VDRQCQCKSFDDVPILIYYLVFTTRCQVSLVSGSFAQERTVVRPSQYEGSPTSSLPVNCIANIAPSTYSLAQGIWISDRGGAAMATTRLACEFQRHGMAGHR
jgi:hypothetical protein